MKKMIIKIQGNYKKIKRIYCGKKMEQNVPV